MCPEDENAQDFRELLTFLQEIGVSEIISREPHTHFLGTETNIHPSTPNAPPPPPLTQQEPALVSENLAQAAQSLEDLRRALQDFEGCSLKKTALNLVFGDGNPHSRVMLVGEAPGADEDRQGLPFVGQSGQLLDKSLSTIGLTRNNFYITNIIPWRPPGNRQPTPYETALYLPFLKRHIDLIKPDFLILVGGTSAKALLGEREGIMRLRGLWKNYISESGKKIKVIPIFHPAYLLRSPGQKREFWRDLLIIKHSLQEAGVDLERAL